MQQAPPLEGSDRQTGLRGRWAEIVFAGILLVALGLCLFILTRAQALSFDTAVFIRFSRQLAEAPWWQDYAAPTTSVREWLLRHSPVLGVIHDHAQHPGFACSILAVHTLIAPICPLGDTECWTLSAQLAAIAGLLLLITAIYRLGRDLLGPAAALSAAAVLALGPTMMRITSDGLSDAPAVAFLVLSAVFYGRLLRHGRVVDALFGSLCAGLGYLMRPEALQLALAVFALLLLQGLVGWSRPRWQTARLVFAVIVPVIICCFPYVYLKGTPLTKKGYLVHLPKILAHQQAHPAPDAEPEPLASAPSEVPKASGVAEEEAVAAVANATPAPTEGDDPPWMSFLKPIHLNLETYLLGVQKFISLWSQILGHGFLPFVLLGIVAMAGPCLRRPDFQLLVGAAAANLLLLPLLLYCLCGYLDIRHVLPAASLTAIWIWPGLLAVGLGMRRSISAFYTWYRGRPLTWPMSAQTACSMVVILGVAALFAYSTTLRLNWQHTGYRHMGEWIRQHYPEETRLVDPSVVVSFYAELEDANRWPYIGNLAQETLVDVLDHFGDAELLVLADQQIQTCFHSDEMPMRVGCWQMEPVHSLRISVDPKREEQIRAFRIRRLQLGQSEPPPDQQPRR